MLLAFSIAPHIVVTPYHKLVSFQLHNGNFSTVMNYSANI